MSKIGQTPIAIPDQVKIKIEQDRVLVTGPEGKLTAPLKRKVEVELKDGQVVVSRADNKPQTRANHGLVRSLINNCVIGVTEGYQKTLKLVGTGYRVKKQGQGLSVTVGYSHPVEIEATEGIELEIQGNDTIIVKGIDKQLVGQKAADIRAIRPPEPYKGKGIRYEGEVVKIKPGKKAVE